MNYWRKLIHMREREREMVLGWLPASGGERLGREEIRWLLSVSCFLGENCLFLFYLLIGLRIFLGNIGSLTHSSCSVTISNNLIKHKQAVFEKTNTVCWILFHTQ